MIVRKVGALMTVTVLAGAHPGGRPPLRVDPRPAQPRSPRPSTSNQRCCAPSRRGSGRGIPWSRRFGPRSAFRFRPSQRSLTVRLRSCSCLGVAVSTPGSIRLSNGSGSKSGWWWWRGVRAPALRRGRLTRSCRLSMRVTARSRPRRTRGIAGKSSGGFGAMITPMLRPDLFGGLASHAGDALYELSDIQGFGKGRLRAARLRRLVREILGGLRVAPAHEQGHRRRPRHHLRGRGSVLGRRGRHRASAVRPAHGTARRRRLGALAGLGPGAHGARSRGCPARFARDLPRRWHPRRGVPGPRALAFRDALAQIGVTDVACKLFSQTAGSSWR